MLITAKLYYKATEKFEPHTFFSQYIRKRQISFYFMVGFKNTNK